MPKLTIDGTEIEVAGGTSVLQACEQLGIEVPRFCFHDKLSVPANCRMCLVEQEKAPKPVPSCAVACADGMVIKTNTEVVKKARQGVMEMLLINHPLDCPICDQGGECDLQDQAVAYGYDRSRYEETKRAVTDKELGPVVKTVMTRCIQCTRCVRFMDEIAGTPELGLTGRGEDVEITTYVPHALTSELSGNIVDICPVGALTSKPYAFVTRPWELRKTESIDVMDAVGSNIRIDVRGGEVLRILPRLNEDINEEWLADKSRLSLDGLKRQRIDKPYVRKDGKLQPASWDEAFASVVAKLKGLPGHKLAALSGDLADVESQFLLRELMDKLGSPNRDCRQDGAEFDVKAAAGWRFNTTIAGIEQADAILLIGTNPRHEAPLINARIRKRWRQLDLPIGLIGEKADLTYTYQYLGAGPASLKDLGSFGEKLKNAKKPMLILGAGVLARPDGAALQARAREIAEQFGLIKEGWNGFNILHSAAGRVGGLEVGFVPGQGGKSTRHILDGAQRGEIDAIINLAADEISPERFGKAFVVYIGHHGDRGAHRADVVLPAAAYTEKNALYVNTEGRAQAAKQAVFPLGEAKEDWKIIRALSEQLGATLPYNQQGEVRKALAAYNSIFGNIGRVVPAEWKAFGAAGSLADQPFKATIENYYMTDPISRASATMAKCTQEVWNVVRASSARTGTHA
jgi:NADH-quinone oxidoreductase subunit G